MTASSYFEYVLTLLGWLVNNGLWQALTATGMVALPLLAKLIALWLKARGQGADEGNVARLLVTWMEHSLYSALLVIFFAGVPFLNVDINTLTSDSQRTKQCGYAVVQPGDSGYAPLINELGGQSASVPVWWYFMHAVGKGLTHAGAGAGVAGFCDGLLWPFPCTVKTPDQRHQRGTKPRSGLGGLPLLPLHTRLLRPGSFPPAPGGMAL